MRNWTEDQIVQLRDLCKQNKYFMNEIGEKIGKRPQAVRWAAHKLGVWSHPVGRHGEKNIKHQHLREEVMKYFLTHDTEETQNYFNLTASELRSLFTNAYKDKKFKHLRKDTRVHKPWSHDDLVYMVRHSGIMPREWIARKLNRGATYNSVKDTLAKFKVVGKYINGMPSRWLEGILSHEEILHYAIKTKAGPTGSCNNVNSNFRYRLIPWVTMESMVTGAKLPKEVTTAIEAMARFQRFIHGTQSEQEIRRRISTVLSEGD